MHCFWDAALSQMDFIIVSQLRAQPERQARHFLQWAPRMGSEFKTEGACKHASGCELSFHMSRVTYMFHCSLLS